VKANPILEEVWRIKDQLAAEATYDVDRFFGQLRAWSEAHPHAAPVVRNAEELRRLATGESALALRGQAAAQGLMLLPAGCIPGPAGSRLHGLEGVRMTPVIQLLSAGGSPGRPEKTCVWLFFRKKDLATIRPSALKYPHAGWRPSQNHPCPLHLGEANEPGVNSLFGPQYEHNTKAFLLRRR